MFWHSILEDGVSWWVKYQGGPFRQSRTER